MNVEKFAPSAPTFDVSQQYRYFWQPPRWQITNPTEHIVEGYASMCNLDDQGDVVPVEAIEAAMPAFMDWGNLRAMHTKIAAGKVLAARVDQEGVWIKAKVTDADSWQKVQDGVYQGFSIGGDVKEIVTRPDGARMITRLQLNEISLVDRPANPRCKISVVKFVASGETNESSETAVTAAASTDTVTLNASVAVTTPPIPETVPDEAVEKKVGPGKVRPDTNPEQGVRDYGNVSFADEANKKYPLDTEAHIRRGWNYINMPKNQRFYTSEAVAAIKRKIVNAWKKKIDPEGPPGAKTDPQIKKTSQPHHNKLAMTVAELEQFKATLVDPDEIATIDKALGLVQGKSSDVEKSSTTADSETDKALFEPERKEKAAEGVPAGPWTDGSEEDTDDKNEDEALSDLEVPENEGIDRWDFIEGKVTRTDEEKASDHGDLTKAEKAKAGKARAAQSDNDADDSQGPSGQSTYHKALGAHLAGAMQACNKCMKAIGDDETTAEHLKTVQGRLQAAQKVHRALRASASTEKALGVERSELLHRIDALEQLVTEHEGNIEMMARRGANFEVYVEKILSQIPASRAVRTTVVPKDDMDDFPAAYKETSALRQRALGR